MNNDTADAIMQGMSAELRAALDRVKDHVMSPEELFEQRVSFVYGQQDWDSPHQKSKDEIREMLIGSYGYPAARHRTTSLAAQDGLVEAVRGLRANDGSNGTYHALKCYEYGKKVDTALASIEVKS